MKRYGRKDPVDPPPSIHELTSRGTGMKTRADAVFAMLRADILGGDLQPDEPLRFSTLRDRFEVSMGTLREALMMLAAARLVVAEGQVGFRVAPLSLADLQDIMQSRSMIDSHCLREAIRRGDAEWEAQIVASFHRLSKATLPGADVRASAELEELVCSFYRALVDACGSPTLLRFHDMLAEQSGRYRRLPMSDAGAKRLAVFTRGLKAIMTATLARDEKKAVAALLEQHRNTLKMSTEDLLRTFPATSGGEPRGKSARNVLRRAGTTR